MEAARVAASRGHEVVLYEKEGKLGGLIPIASMVKDLEIDSLLDLIRYYQIQLAKLGVTVKAGEEIGPSDIEAYKPDVIILAMGGLPDIAKIPGIDNPKVVSTADLKKKLGIFLKNREDFAAFREIRAQYLTPPFPPTTLLVVKSLAREEWLLEVEAMAVLD